jgi:transposase
MAPRLAASQHDMIRDMISSKSLKTIDMAAAADCSDRTIRNIRSNLRCFGSSRAPFNGGGRRRQITPVMLEALRVRLLEKPGMYQDEMALFLYDEFQILVNNSAVSRALASIGSTTSPPSSRTTSSTWMSQGATIASASGAPAGHRSVLLQCR